MNWVGKVRHLAGQGKQVHGENPHVCTCLVVDRKLTKVKASITGDVDRVACLRCRKWFIA